MTNVGPDHSILAKSLLEVKANIQYHTSITKTFRCTNYFTYWSARYLILSVSERNYWGKYLPCTETASSASSPPATRIVNWLGTATGIKPRCSKSSVTFEVPVPLP